jgi:acetyl-CoA C-acetyltransferase
MPEPVHAIGFARTDFRRNLRKEGRTLRDVVVEAARAAIADSGIPPQAITSGVVASFAPGRFVKQLHLGSYLCDVDPALRGIPTLRVEAACASGGVAFMSAIHQVASGAHDVVLVVGAEQQKTMSPADGADVLAAAGDYASESPAYGPLVFPGLFARVALDYRDRYGLTDAQLAAVATKNRQHAALNPMAQLRESPITLEQACGMGAANPMIAEPLKLSDCSQITDGAAAVLLCSQQFLERHGLEKNSIRLAGFGHTTDYLSLDRKDSPTFSIARKSAERAYAMTGVTPSDIDGADLHDCFSISEIVACEIVGFAENGQAARLIATGATAHPKVRDRIGPGGPRAPIINPGGGLIADGHPVGATGVRQVVEAGLHLTGRAGLRQIEGARRYLTYNMGGTMTTAVTMIWEGAR